MNFNTLRPFLSRLISPWIGALFAALAIKAGIAPDEVLVNRTAETIVDIILWVVPAIMSIAGVAKQFIDRKVNPADTASITLAERGKDEHRSLTGKV
jgi:hypothetical protein